MTTYRKNRSSATKPVNRLSRTGVDVITASPLEETKLLIGILETLSQSRSMDEYLEQLIEHLKKYSGCRCIGIRLLDDEGNIPYTSYDGFSREFYESESPLSLKYDKCMCINVIKGATDPSLPFYTDGGSFLSNGTTRLLASVTDEAKGQTRNVCNQSGYESVALVPMRHKDRILGLIHLADESENKVPEERVRFLEQVGVYIGEALHTFMNEEALRQSEEHYSALVRNLTDAVFEIKEGVVTWCNDSVEYMYGYKRDELIGKEASFFYPEHTSSSEFEEAVSAGIKERGFFRSTAKFRKEDGSMIDIEYSISQIPDRDPIEVVAVARDVTERTKTENILQIIMENTDANLAYLDSNFNFIRVNSAYARGSGHTADELIGQNHFHLFPNEENQAIFERVRDTGEPVQFKAKPFMFMDQPWRGTTYWDWTLIPVKDSTGSVQGLVLSVVDVTERRRAEEALRHERDNLISILEAMEDGVYIVNQQYNIEYINPALRKEFGPVERKKCHEYFNDRREPCPWCKNEEVFKGETVRWEWYFSKNEKTYDLIDTPVKNPDGSVSKLVIFRDITQRKKLDQMKDEFIGLVSHELRSPLTVVIGAVNTALTEAERLSTEETRQLLQDAASEAESLSHLLGNLLELSRVQADRLFLHVEPINIENAIQSAVEEIRQKSPTRRFVIDLPKRLPLVPADQLRVERILHNLLENADKYSPRGGDITVFAKRDKKRLLIGISDQGIGISPQDQAKLFGPFQRLEDSRLEGIKGIGLGLLVCRRLVEAHGGQIWVESEPGQGTIFFFTLPLRQAIS